MSAAREELRRALQGPAETPALPAVDIARLQAQVELRDAQAETGTQRLAVLRRLAEVIIGERSMWQTRFATFHAKRLGEIREGYGRLEKMDWLLRSEKPYFQSTGRRRPAPARANRTAEGTRRTQADGLERFRK